MKIVNNVKTSFLKCLLASIVFGVLVLAFVLVVGISWAVMSILFPVTLTLLIGAIILVTGVIVIGTRSQFFALIIIDKKLGALDAIKESWRITRNNVGKLFLFMLGIFLISLLISLVFYIPGIVLIKVLGAPEEIISSAASIVITPLTTASLTYVYRKLSPKKSKTLRRV